MIKFNVGCGKRNWPGWVNVDGADYPHVTDHDITLQYQPPDYIDLLYSSHLIAYFDREEAAQLLAGWYKKIKPGGIIQIATPDWEELSEYGNVLPIEDLLGPLYGRMEMNGGYIYHKTVWDYISMRNALLTAGFKSVKLYDHRYTNHPNTGNREDMFDDHSAAYLNGLLISLNVEATKPL